MLGLGEQSLVGVEVDKSRRIDIDKLREALEAHGTSRDIFCVVATAGTTSTGSVDPIAPIADLCRELGIWLHVDGAYGLAYKLVPEWKNLFAGIQEADSVSWDPHKQLAVPIPCSVLFCRRNGDFGRMAYHSSYFNREDSPEPNPGTKSAPTTRPLAALALVTSIVHQGLFGLTQRLKAPLAAVKEAARYLENQPDMELLNWPDTGILCFRVMGPGLQKNRLDALQKRIYDGIIKDGKRSISISQIGDKTALRLVAISTLVTFEALKETIREVRAISKTV
jgi:L-2,4-diaminobutyrate decarboxylase